MAVYVDPRNGKSWVYKDRTGNADPGISPSESFGPDDNRAVRTIDWFTAAGQSAWGSRKELVEMILGSVTKADATRLTRYPPMPYPDMEKGGGGSMMHATRILSVEGVGAPTDGNFSQSLGNHKTPRYHIVRTKIQFESTLYTITVPGLNPVDESTWSRYVVTEIQPAGQMITLPKGLLKFVAGQVPAAVEGKDPTLFGANIGKPIPMADIKITWRFVPDYLVPSSTLNPNTYTVNGVPLLGPIEGMLGKVNKTAWNGYGPGTLLYMGCQMRPIKSWYETGTGRLYDVTMNLSFNPNTHQKVPYRIADQFNGVKLGWVEVNAGGTASNIPGQPTNGDGVAGQSIFDWAELKHLFRPADPANI